MAALEFPKVVYGPGGQSKKVMSKEAFAQLGPEWKTSRAAANPTSEYPMYVYKGSESKVIYSAEEKEDGWVESSKDALAGKSIPKSEPKVITAPDGSTSTDGGVTWVTPEKKDDSEPEAPSETETPKRGPGRPPKVDTEA